MGGKEVVRGFYVRPSKLQDPFKWRTGVVMHIGKLSTTLCPYTAALVVDNGHSNLLAGVLLVKEWKQVMFTRTVGHDTNVSPTCSSRYSRKLFDTRMQSGNVMGFFEAWLLLRTLHLRVPHQSQTVTPLAQ